MEQMPAPSYAPRKIEYKEPKKLPITAIAVVIIIAILAAGVYLLLQPAPKPKLAISVKTTDGYMIDGAVAKITGPQTLSRDVSGGSTELELQSGDYQVTVSAFGFSSKTLSAHLPGDGTLKFELAGMRFTVPQQMPLAPRDSYNQDVAVFNDKGDPVTVRMDADSSLKRYFGMPDAFPVTGKKAVNVTLSCGDATQADCASGLKPVPVKEGDKLVYSGNLLIKLLNGTSPGSTVTVPFKLVFEKERRYTVSGASLTLYENETKYVDIPIRNTGSGALRNIVLSTTESEIAGFSLDGTTILGKAVSIPQISAGSDFSVRTFIRGGQISTPSYAHNLAISVDIGTEHKSIAIGLTVQKPKP